MTQKEVKQRIQMTIDQFYRQSTTQWIEKAQLFFISGILQTALHLVDTDTYYSIKQYIYQQYGYDPGGCSDGQITMDDMEG